MYWLCPGDETYETDSLLQMINTVSKAWWGDQELPTPSLWMQVEEAEVLERHFISGSELYFLSISQASWKLLYNRKSFEAGWKL